ncbi:OmpA family protein [Hymenobacter artigasi]|uniref:Outer membrane protein OmpA-like peptidoglycan-associated protein n=1 Tax=Hymenobacter artigasi TaxID=2719616 RepID=A0ABX1HLP0_9BACT|nr:OmpA family protein [Hymenobacter artigasi]NKI91130.1 outer membrane protein OmpA-like peptidoglycan-associated protein [Hymenobacter artigasi]
MKIFLLLVLLVCQLALRAQPTPPATQYTNALARYQLAYARGWVPPRAVGGPVATFTAGAPVVGATVKVSQQSLPDDRRDLRLLGAGRPDSVWQRIQRLPRVQVLRLDQHSDGPTDEIDYEYTYAPPAPALRAHVLGRQLWRGGYEFRVEYRAATAQDGRYLAEGRQLVESFAFTNAAWPSRRYADQICDGKMYGIAALRFHDGQWEDDCRTIHEFSTSNPTATPRAHRLVLPFQSYALAKGFDNCLYSVTKAPTNAPERVYRYDPAARRGAYTDWQLPAQGPENVWISAATDDHGDLYFMTSDANQLVRVSPHEGRVSVVWAADPIRKAPYYSLIGFASAGTHGNFCLDDANTMYMVYSTDGSLLKVNMNTKQPSPERIMLDGLPVRGGYSDLLMQNDAAGRRRMYLAGPHGLYQVDLARRQATRVRGGTYTDLAGCNLFGVVPPAPAVPPPTPTTATWEGRVLDATTSLPLPQAQLRLDRDEAGTAVLLSVRGSFTYTTAPGRSYQYHAQHPGYFPADSTWAAAPGPLVHDILLRPLAVGATQQLANVQFEQGKAAMLPSSAAALNKLVLLMIDNPNLTIELRGHTDNVGPPEKNVVLSQQRVAAVKAYLADHGVAGTRITGLGLGGAEPIASNEQEATRRLNRRVEFRIVGLQ